MQPGSLVIVHVQVQVLPERVAEFAAAAVENGTASLREPGVVRFDVIQDLDDATHFVLVEVYRDAAAVAAHKETPHYRKWRDLVAPMMATPRSSRKFVNLHPADARWQTT